MSEEEKEAIRILKNFTQKMNYCDTIDEYDVRATKIVLNLIEKLQKEIEEKEELKVMPKYRFTMIYKNTDKYGHYSEEQYTVSLIAETLEQAKQKLDKIAPNETDIFKDILQWNAVEILEEK